MRLEIWPLSGELVALVRDEGAAVIDCSINNISRPLRGLPLSTSFSAVKTARYYHPSRVAGLEQLSPANSLASAVVDYAAINETSQVKICLTGSEEPLFHLVEQIRSVLALFRPANPAVALRSRP